MVDRFLGDGGEPEGLGGSFGAVVRFEVADDDVDAGLQCLLGIGKHCVGFADSGGHAEIDFKLAVVAPFLGNCFKEGIGIRSSFVNQLLRPVIRILGYRPS